MLEKPKRVEKVFIQDRIQPTTIEELIRKYDLDNTQIYDYLDYLVKYLNDKNIDANYIDSLLQEKIGVIDVTDQYTTNFTSKEFEVLYYPFYNKIEIRLVFDKIAKGGWQTLAVPNNDEFTNVEEFQVPGYGSAATFTALRITDKGEIQSYDTTGNTTFVSGFISTKLKKNKEVK